MQDRWRSFDKVLMLVEGLCFLAACILQTCCRCARGPLHSTPWFLPQPFFHSATRVPPRVAMIASHVVSWAVLSCPLGVRVRFRKVFDRTGWQVRSLWGDVWWGQNHLGLVKGLLSPERCAPPWWWWLEDKLAPLKCPIAMTASCTRSSTRETWMQVWWSSMRAACMVQEVSHSSVWAAAFATAKAIWCVARPKAAVVTDYGLQIIGKRQADRLTQLTNWAGGMGWSCNDSCVSWHQGRDYHPCPHWMPQGLASASFRHAAWMHLVRGSHASLYLPVMLS